MARKTDPKVLAKWQRWKAEYDADENISAPEFAVKKGVTLAAVYWWFRKLRDLESDVGLNLRATHERHVLQERRHRPAPSSSVNPDSLAGSLDIHLPGGVILKATPENMALVRAVLADLAQSQPSKG